MLSNWGSVERRTFTEEKLITQIGNTYEQLANPEKNANNAESVISGLRSPTKMWKWSARERRITIWDIRLYQPMQERIKNKAQHEPVVSSLCPLAYAQLTLMGCPKLKKIFFNKHIILW
jgi:hypothetical protein